MAFEFAAGAEPPLGVRLADVAGSDAGLDSAAPDSAWHPLTATDARTTRKGTPLIPDILPPANMPHLAPIRFRLSVRSVVTVLNPNTLVPGRILSLATFEKSFAENFLFL